MSWIGKAAIVVLVIIVIGSGARWYVGNNYVPKPEPFDARSVLQGMKLREVYFNMSIQAYQRRDTVSQNAIAKGLQAVIDSLAKDTLK